MDEDNELKESFIVRLPSTLLTKVIAKLDKEKKLPKPGSKDTFQIEDAYIKDVIKEEGTKAEIEYVINYCKEHEHYEDIPELQAILDSRK